MSVSQISEKIGDTLGPLVDIFYPRVCLVCSEREAKSAPLICSKCWKDLLRLIHLTQKVDSPPKPARTAGPDFPSRQDSQFVSLPIISLAEFVDPLAEMIRLFKFQGYVRLGQRLGRLLAQRKSAEIRDLSTKWLIATPLHISDFRRRGFNQAEILSDILSRACGAGAHAVGAHAVGAHAVGASERLIAKPVRTKHQSRLRAEERAYNLAGAFEALAPELRGARVALVDDVITTGSTIREIGRTLVEAGAEVVGAVALASQIQSFRLTEDEDVTDGGNADDEETSADQ